MACQLNRYSSARVSKRSRVWIPYSLSETEKVASENAMIVFTFHFLSHNSKISFSYWFSTSSLSSDGLLYIYYLDYSVILKLKLLTEAVKQEELRKGKKVTIFTNLHPGTSDLWMAQKKIFRLEKMILTFCLA